MTLRRLTLAAALPLLLAAPSAFAQTTPPATQQSGDRPRMERGERMFEGLDLSDAQKTQLREAFAAQRERFRPQMEALRNDAALTDAQRQERRAALMAQMRTETEAAARRILTPEQFTRFSQMRQRMQERRPDGERRQRMQERPGQNRPGPSAEAFRKRGGRAAEALGLSDAQKTQLRSIAERQRGAVQALRNEPLTADQRRTRMQGLMAQFRQERQAVLTPEQRQRTEQMRQNGRERMQEHRERRWERRGTEARPAGKPHGR